MRIRLIAIIAGLALALSCLAFGSQAGATPFPRATCSLLSARFVGSAGARLYYYDLTVKLTNNRLATHKITATIKDNWGWKYSVSATVATYSSVTKTSRVRSRAGATYTVTGCS